MRSDFNNVATDEIQSRKTAQDRQYLRRCRIESINVETEIGRAIANDLPYFIDNRPYAELPNLLGMNDGHPGGVGEFPQILRVTANTDLDGSAGIEHAIKDGLPKRTAVMKFAAFERSAGVTMSVDMDHPDSAIPAYGAKKRQAYRMVAADGEWNDVRLDNATDEFSISSCD